MKHHRHTNGHIAPAGTPGTTPAAALPGARGDYKWGPRNIRWGLVFKMQHWGGLITLILAVVVIVVSHWIWQEQPHIRTAFAYDASISYQLTENPTVPNALAVIYNWIALLITVVVVEVFVYYKRHSVTTAVTAVVHFLWSSLINFIIVVALTEVTKPLAGELRPDFLSRCVPDPAQRSNFQLGETVTCTSNQAPVIADGRLAFVSGHSSNTMSLAWYGALYTVWSLFLRDGSAYSYHLFNAPSWWRRLLRETWYACIYIWLIFVLGLSWFIGVTRLWDNVHDTADIVGGFLLAIMFTTPYFIMTAAQYRVFLAQIDKHQLQVVDVNMPGEGPITGHVAVPVGNGDTTGGAMGAGVGGSSAGAYRSDTDRVNDVGRLPV